MAPSASSHVRPSPSALSSGGGGGTTAATAPATSSTNTTTTKEPAAKPSSSTRPPSPHFPPHNAPRVWILTNGTAPITIGLAQQVLEHGDYVLAGVPPLEYEREPSRSAEFRAFLAEAQRTERWRERLRVVGLDGRHIGQCQAAVAEAVEAFGRVDVLLASTAEAVVGTIEELGQSERTRSVARDQFETNFFANVNIIKAVLPVMRAGKNGHIIMLTGITGHLGTPGLGIYCASQWAIEGYCDSLAYEIAPFNIKVTIVQPNMEVAVLTNRITAVPPLPDYAPDVNPAPLAREILAGLLDKLAGVGGGGGGTRAGGERAGDPSVSPSVPDDPNNHNGSGTVATDANTPSSRSRSSNNNRNVDRPGPTPGDLLSSPRVTSVYATLPTAGVRAALVAETVHALTAIGGHDNPPARHIVGFEAVASVKEKLKTVSEELEDFLEVSAAVDVGKDEELERDEDEEGDAEEGVEGREDGRAGSRG